jgi:hypothetical protein
MQDLITTKQVGNRLSLNYNTVLSRAKHLGIEPESRFKAFYWSNSQIKEIADCRSIKAKIKINAKNSPVKLLIVDYFIHNQKNGIALIAKKFDVGVQYVTNVLDEYLKDQCVVVESKMNSDDL